MAEKETSSRRKRVFYMTTSPMSVNHFSRGYFEYLRENGWEVIASAGPAPQKGVTEIRDRGFRVVTVPIVRPVSLIHDAWCLLRLWWHFLWNRYHVIHVSTPKAMLLGTIAARFAFQNRVLLTVRGRAYENFTGRKRKLLQWLDKLTCRLARHVVPICRELGECLVHEGIVNRKKIVAIGPSSNGVNSKRFERTPVVEQQGRELREQLGIPSEAVVILSVGRVRREKGINELVSAFETLGQSSEVSVHLVLLGSDETDVDPIEPQTCVAIGANAAIHVPGGREDAVPWYAMADIVAFPSYREGFGNISIEAAAMGLPTVGYDIMGLREGIVEGETGYLVPLYAVDELAEALGRLVDSKELRRSFREPCRQWAVENFNSQTIWDAWLTLYEAQCKS